MKIAYYIYWLDGFESGVLKKITSQMDYWLKENNQVKLFILTKENSNLAKDYVKIKDSLKIDVEIVTINNKISYFFNSKLYKKIKEYNPDLVYFRESKLNYVLYKINKQFKSIIELNSITINEINNPLIKTFLRITDKLFFKNIDGVIGVTQEILNFRKKILKHKFKITIGNGIDLSRTSTLPIKTTGDNINLIFIGTAGQKWHGIDEIIQLSKIKKDWFFHIVGINKSNTQNLHFYGRLDKKEYLEIFSKSQIAIGTLALYRKNMNEACPLKTREYLAYGLPVIIGYRDVDFPNKPEFICQLPNKLNNLVENLSKIEEFVAKWKDKRITTGDIKNIDVKQKEKIRLSFFKKVIYEN